MGSNLDSLDCIATINNENVVSRELEGEAVILNLESGIYFGLNNVGTRVWALIQEHGSVRKVVELLQHEYEVDPSTLKKDLRELLDQLQSRGLVSLAPPSEFNNE